MPVTPPRGTETLPILLVEDEDDTRELLRALLESDGHVVVPAQNGREALDWLVAPEHHAGLLLLDLLMPVMTGMELLDELQLDSRFDSLPIVVTTGLGEPALSQALDRHRPRLRAVLAKPLSLPRLREVLQPDLAPTVLVPGVAPFGAPPRPRSLSESKESKESGAEPLPIERVAPLAWPDRAQGSSRYGAAVQRLLDASNDGFWDWNIETGAVYFSERWAHMLGYELSEIDPSVRSWEVLLHPDDRETVLQALNAHLEGRTDHYETEHRLRMRSGGWKWILDRGAVVERSANGKPLRAVGAHIDITSRKLLEFEKEGLLEAREQLLSVVSHELNNPLNAILASSELIRKQAQLLLEGAAPPLRSSAEPSLLRALDTTGRAVHRMLRLVTDLLDATAIERGALSFTPLPTEVEDLVRIATVTLEKEASAKRVRFELDVPGTLPTLQVDEDRLVQLLSNLLHNAIKFSPVGGQIVVRAQLCAEVGAPRGIELSITDEGPGIPPEELPHIFDKFWQSKRWAYAGTGLGLFIARAIAEAHGGTLFAETRPEGGARFVLRLPLPDPDGEGSK